MQLDTQCVHSIHIECLIVLIAIPRQNAYMHEQTTKGFRKMNISTSIFGVRIGWRKYLNECTPFGYVSLCFSDQATFFVVLPSGTGDNSGGWKFEIFLSIEGGRFSSSASFSLCIVSVESDESCHASTALPWTCFC